MPRRNTSQRPSEPPQDRSDRLRAGRPAPTGSARLEKQALHPPVAGRGRGGGTRLARVDVAGGSTSQTSLSQTVNPTQYQQDYQVYEQAQDQAYHFQEPQLYQFDAYQQHQYEDHREQPDIEQEQPDIEQPQQDDIEQPQQHDGGARFHGVPRVVYEASLDGYAGGPSDLRLLSHFGGHVACRIWVDADVSII